MTSEVVVMNRLGVALASDSAATVFVGGRVKSYHADKLFMLSNHHPVGVMVYNNSSLLGVPWETILKMFRAELGTRSFPTLQEYGQHLIEYLNNNSALFPEAVQQQYYVSLVDTLFQGIQQGVHEVWVANADSDPDNLSLQSAVIQASLEEWRGYPDVAQECFEPQVADELVDRASGEIHNLVKRYFPGFQAADWNHLRELAKLVVSKEKILDESLSGLVIAGYGDSQHFPAMQEYTLGEIFKGRLKYKTGRFKSIDAKTPSDITPFAQSEMVETFLAGISPQFEIEMIKQISVALMTTPDEVVDGIPRVSKKRKEEYKDKVRAASAAATDAVLDKLAAFRAKKHLNPILQSIEFLPKNELAHVAASLVNLSSFQKRMSISEDETVGGPIDVAVISKGDGFVWIDRKHYFKPELNRHFFHRLRPTADSARHGVSDDKEGARNHHQAGSEYQRAGGAKADQGENRSGLPPEGGAGEAS